MEQKKFINREKELAFLSGEYEKKSSSLTVIYGRRRIGKTALIKEFIKNKPALYFLASEEMEQENLNNLRRMIADFTGNKLLQGGSGYNWEDLITVFVQFSTENEQQKCILIIDEFQYIGKHNEAFPSVFQRIWDEILERSNIMVILCGSLINMMNSQVLSYSSPLYGRRTGQIRLQQIKFRDYGLFYESMPESELIKHYAVTGGVPKYIEAFQNSTDIFWSIRERILSRQSYLYEEPIFLLEREVSETGTYFSLIKTIAQGKHKLGNIASALGVPQNLLTKYLSNLISMDLIERKVPVTESNPEKSKMGLYYIKDNFINFWFKFIYPFRSYLELDETEFVMQRIKDNYIDSHLSFVYEKICMERLSEMNNQNKLKYKLLRIGSWWNNQDEIDIVGLNHETGEIVFGECKYTNKPASTDILVSLQEKARQVNWHSDRRKENFIIFSRSGFSDNLTNLAHNRDDLHLIQVG